MAGDSIGITLREQIFVERGYVASHGTATPIETNRFHADLFWMAKEPLRLDAPYTIRLATQELKGRVVAINQIMDSATLNTTTAPRREVARNEIGRVTIQTRAAIVLDNHDRIANLGRFVVIDEGRISGGGIVFGGAYYRSHRGQKQKYFLDRRKNHGASNAR